MTSRSIISPTLRAMHTFAFVQLGYYKGPSESSVMKSQAVSLPTTRYVFALHWHLFFRVLKRHCGSNNGYFFREIS